jgi:peptide/nickel transport system ATP-binding protein
VRAEPALHVRGLDVAYEIRGNDRQVLRSLSFEIAAGESYGLVGESGCGKSTVALAVTRYLPRNGRILGGELRLEGRDLLAMGEAELREARARRVSMVYQDPGRALDPSMRVGAQLEEVFQILGHARDQRQDAAAEMLRKVQIGDPGRVMGRYPHQLSGGMQQRVVIAMALASNPGLLILDEPTTGLDATVEAEVLDLVAQLREEFRSAILFISHNLAVIAKMCDRVGVVYAGTLVEESDVRSVFEDPRHPYTVALLRCIPTSRGSTTRKWLDSIPGLPPPPGAIPSGCVFAPRCALADARCRDETPALEDIGGRLTRCHHHSRAQELPRETPENEPGREEPDRTVAPLVELHCISKTYSQDGHEVRAVSDVSFAIWPGETLGLVGESGSGKTTIAHLLAGITAADAGSRMELAGSPLLSRISERSADQVRAIQIVFQNPDSALNRSHTVRVLIGRALTKLAGLRGEARELRLRELASAVKLSDRYLSVRPAALSGGLKQRVAIARAFAGNPRLVVCDEPTSALDVSVQATILNLLATLQRDAQVAYLFISHDLGVVRYLSDRIAVLYLGRVMEIGAAGSVFDGGPNHPYTEALLSEVPQLNHQARPRIKLHGEIPSPSELPSGCVFHTRCPRKIGSICETTEPPLLETEAGHAIRCHIPPAELAELQRRETAPAPPVAVTAGLGISGADPGDRAQAATQPFDIPYKGD